MTGGKLHQNVDVDHIDAFLRSWVNADQSITTQIPPLRRYIADRKEEEIPFWDVLVGSLSKGDAYNIGGWSIVPMERRIHLPDLKNDFLSIGGRKMRVSSRGVERTGIDDTLASAAEASYRRELGTKQRDARVNYPGYIYRRVRQKPLLALYFIDVSKTPDGDKYASDNFPDKPVVAWAISFPKSNTADERVEYIINTVKQHHVAP